MTKQQYTITETLCDVCGQMIFDKTYNVHTIEGKTYDVCDGCERAIARYLVFLKRNGIADISVQIEERALVR